MTALFAKRVLAVLLILSAGADQVSAQPPAPAYEFRGATRGRQGYVSHIWKLLADGRVTGRFRATGIRPKVSDKIAAAGFPLAATMFEHVKLVA